MGNMIRTTIDYHQEDLEKVEDIKKSLNLNGRTEAVRKAIGIAHRIIEEKKKGNEILINKKPFDFFGI